MMKSEPFDRSGLPVLRMCDADGDEKREQCRLIVGSAADDLIVASLELHCGEGELHGRAVRIAGIGALFTPPEQRGRRYGAALVAMVVDRARHDGFHLALLFSDIGADYFTRLGFSPLPGGEASCVTVLPAPWPGEPAWVGGADPPQGVPGLRTGGPGDFDAIVRLHEGYEASAAFRLMRSRRAWDRLLLRPEAGRGPRQGGERDIWMVDDRSGPVAYAVLQEQGEVLRWLEHGARPGGDGRLGDLFWAAIARARRHGLSRLEGWSLPRGAAGEPLYPIARRARRRPLLMARALQPDITLTALRDATVCRIGELDRF
ncbi:MAG TPA: GNAT family N-acetyltransferase [Candidatus Polarisedimenticolia bacterium]|nr:GNAT family N-acetyltransferase [Candidatus Polarisedimenticolia bacterium]